MRQPAADNVTRAPRSRTGSASSRLLLGALLTFAIAVGGASLAIAATGDLTGVSCISDVGDPGGCGAPSQQGLADAESLVLSPDQKSLYAVGEDDDAIVRFDRDPGSGVLTPAGCISDVGDTAGCGTTQQGLDGARGVDISPDGEHVYATAASDDAVTIFDRNPATGALTPLGCISDVGDPAGCGTTAQGLSSANDVAVSPDGKNVYTTSYGDDAIVTFTRNATTGLLTPAGCISDAPDAAGCGADAANLSGAAGMAFSADGSRLYMAAMTSNAVTTFSRDTSTGALTPSACVADTGEAGCAGTTDGLEGVEGVAISPDGKSVYGSSDNADSSVVGFSRNTTTGALTPIGCISDVGDPGGCGTTTQGLGGASGVEVSGDGRNVYVASDGDEAVVTFTRNTTTGALTPVGCIADAGDPAGCLAEQQGLESAEGTALSADGRWLYVVADDDNAIVTLSREPAPECSDAIDNDGDGLIDFGSDPECDSEVDDSEADTTAPVLTLKGKKKQRSFSKVKVKASCDEDCAVTVKASGKAKISAKKKLSLKPAKADLVAGKSKTLKLKFKGKSKKVVKKALKRGKTIRLKLKGTATDAAGNKRKAKFKVKLKR